MGLLAHATTHAYGSVGSSTTMQTNHDVQSIAQRAGEQIRPLVVNVPAGGLPVMCPPRLLRHPGFSQGLFEFGEIFRPVGP